MPWPSISTQHGPDLLKPPCVMNSVDPAWSLLFARQCLCCCFMHRLALVCCRLLGRSRQHIAPDATVLSETAHVIASVHLCLSGLAQLVFKNMLSGFSSLSSTESCLTRCRSWNCNVLAAIPGPQQASAQHAVGEPVCAQQSSRLSTEHCFSSLRNAFGQACIT